jgi:transcriptional regulator with XRE-family HTH domain
MKPQPSSYPQALNTLGDWIRYSRLERGLTQAQTGAIVGVSECCVTNWELGHTKPEIGYIPAIIEFIGYCPYIPTTDLIARLKTIRWAPGLTQEKLAKLMGIDESSLCSWERGEHRPTKKSRKVIAELLSTLTLSPQRE